MVSIDSVIDRMSTTQTIIGAKNQLISNLQRLSAVLIQTLIARGGIFDEDAAGEVSRLAKKQILADAAIADDISLASAQKRNLTHTLL